MVARNDHPWYIHAGKSSNPVTRVRASESQGTRKRQTEAIAHFPRVISAIFSLRGFLYEVRSTFASSMACAMNGTRASARRHFSETDTFCFVRLYGLKKPGARCILIDSANSEKEQIIVWLK